MGPCLFILGYPRLASWMLPNHVYSIPQCEPLIGIVRNRCIHHCVSNRHMLRSPTTHADPRRPTSRPGRGGCEGCRASLDWQAGEAIRPLGNTPASLRPKGPSIPRVAAQAVRVWSWPSPSSMRRNENSPLGSQAAGASGAMRRCGEISRRRVCLRVPATWKES
jgi:hypothetical protein